MQRTKILRLPRSWRDFLPKRTLLQTALLASLFWLHIQDASAFYGLNADYMTRVARCESQLDPTVRSKNGLYHGGYQYSWRTWVSFSSQAGWEGYSPYDPEAAAWVTAWAFSRGYAYHWPRCRYA